MTPQEMWARLLGRLRRNRFEDELDEEIEAHLALATEENVRTGMSPEQARREALRQFGGVTEARERVHVQIGLPTFDALGRDLRLAVRGLRRSPGFALVATATLALGIGICSAFFSILNGTLLTPAPGLADPDSLYATEQALPYLYFEALRDQADAAISVAFWTGPTTFNAKLQGTDPTRPDRVDGHIVSPGYFRTLGVEPSLGRTLDDLEDDSALPGSVFVSHNFWRTRLGADGSRVGKRLFVNGRAVTLVGVGPPRFRGVFPSGEADIFVPADAGPELAPELDAGLVDAEARIFRTLLRLAPGVKASSAEAALETRVQALDAALRAGGPVLESDRQRIRLIPAGGTVSIPPRMRAAGLALYAVLIGLVLALTCASLAGLVMARGGSRAKEMAVRLSLGASRGQLVRQLLAESAVLATAGGAAGLVAAYAMIRALTTYAGGAASNSGALQPDLRVALITFAIAAFAAVGFGLLPALGATRPDLLPALKGDSGGGLPRLRKLGLRNLFVVTQVAVSLSLILVVGALTLGSSRSAGQDPGFDTSRIHVFTIDPRRDGFRARQSLELARKVAETLEGAPGVEAATFGLQVPLKLGVRRQEIDLPGAAMSAAQVRPVEPGHFAALGAKVVLGRDLDSASKGQAVVNQAAAEALFGSESPLGRRIHLAERAFEIVGVARYGVPAPFTSEAPPTVFVPATAEELDQGVAIAVRTPHGLDAETLRRAVKSADPRLSWFNTSTLDDSISELERARQSATALNVGLAGFAFVLACVGLAGVTAQAVERRRKEIGIEIALGARWAQVMRGVMKEGAAMTVCGVALGWALALGLSRALVAASAQFAAMIPAGASAWALMLGTPLALAALAMTACFWPARRAAATDPLIVLRAE